jgi:hypothetical protein
MWDKLSPIDGLVDRCRTGGETIEHYDDENDASTYIKWGQYKHVEKVLSPG